jgi:AAHS family 4-hydroxybenzoate transporter-like MFS transporter
MAEPVFNVSEFINRQRIGRLQIMVMLLCALIMVADGYDAFVVGFILRPLAQAFGVSPAAIVPVFALQSVGIAIGASLAGMLADRFGRRRLLLTSAVLLGLLTLATTQASSVGEVIALRFVAGIFFGAILPNAVAITVEFAPERLRATMVNWMFIGYVGGVAAGGGVTALFVTSYGWQSAFWVGGLVPLAISVLLYMFLPESIRFCALRDSRDPRIAGVLRRMSPGLSLTGQERFVLDEVNAAGLPLVALFREGRAPQTVLIWVAYFMNILVISLLGAFLPIFLHNFGGLSLERAAAVTSFYSICGLTAMLVYGRLIDLFGGPLVITLTSILACISVAALGEIDLASGWIYLAMVFVGAGVVAAQAGLHALCSMMYPTRMRATGLGWAMGIGRVGGMAGPLIGGMALAGHWSALPSFLTGALPMLLVGAATAGIGFVLAPARRRPDAVAQAAR